MLAQTIASVGVQLSWDVFHWGKKKQDLAQYKRALEQARNSVAETASQIVLDGNSSFRIEGQFVSIDQGNRTRRLVIGLGAGASEVRTLV